MSKGKSCCVFGAKGGNGKTTITINLAGTLSNAGKKVLIIDLDLYNSTIACALNKQPKKDIFNFCDDYQNNRYESIEKYITKYNENIDFIAAPKDPRRANKIEPKYIDILLDKCIFLYDVVLVDMNHSLDEISVFTLDKVDRILLITSNDPLDLKNLSTVLTILKDNEIDKYKVLLNNSVANNRDYFSLYDLKVILDNNIDYIISSDFHDKYMDALIFDGKISTILNKKLKDYHIFELIIKDLVDDNK